jgi:hypothetical protein
VRTAGTRHVLLVVAGLTLAACVSVPKAGAIGESAAAPTRITAVDSARPPRSVSVELDEAAYVVVLLVAPGHSATLLYPPDSTTTNRLPAGAHTLNVTVPGVLLESDSARLAGMIRTRDSSRVRTRGPTLDVERVRTRGPTLRTPALQPTTSTYFLVITSPQQLSYNRIVAKIGGFTIPTVELEALNAVGKAVKATIEADPRVWNGFYQAVSLFPKA